MYAYICVYMCIHSQKRGMPDFCECVRLVTLHDMVILANPSYWTLKCVQRNIRSVLLYHGSVSGVQSEYERMSSWAWVWMIWIIIGYFSPLYRNSFACSFYGVFRIFVFFCMFTLRVFYSGYGDGLWGGISDFNKMHMTWCICIRCICNTHSKLFFKLIYSFFLGIFSL